MTPRLYIAERRAAARAAGNCQQCLKRPGRIVDGKRRSQCQVCIDAYTRPVSRPAKQRTLSGYQPIDETLQLPRVRLLRALRWFDWVTLHDLLDALDMDECDDRPRWAHKTAMHLLSRGGFVETLRVPLVGVMYRITAKGRAELAGRIALAMSEAA